MSKKWIKKTLFGLGLSALVIPITTACAVGTNKFVVGNYDAYVDPDVSKELQTNFKTNTNGFLSYVYYSNNEIVEGYLKSRSLDIAIISQYTVAKLAKRKVIKKIDWSKFDLHDANGKLITKTEQLKPFFSDTTWQLSQAYSDYLGDLDNDQQNEQLLDYMVPYFYQDLIFAYRGKEIPALKPENNPTWADIFWAIQNEDRFNPEIKTKLYERDGSVIYTNDNPARLTFISDPRTIYDLARIMQTSESLTEKDYADLVKWQTWIKLEETKAHPDLQKIKEWKQLFANKAPNVQNQPKASIDDIETTFNALNHYTEKLPKNTIRFDPNSNNVLNNLATLETVGVIGYNGDISFALNGGEYADVKKYEQLLPTTKDFHFVRPRYTLNVMDGLVINDLIDEKHLDGAYDYIKNLVFEGINDTDNDGVLRWGLNVHKGLTDEEINKYESTDLEAKEEGNILEDQSYFYMPMRNFDYLNYTPTLRAVYEHVLDINEGYLGNTAFQIDLVKNLIANEDPKDFMTSETFGFDPRYYTKQERQKKHTFFDALAEILYEVYTNNKKPDVEFVYAKEFLDDQINWEENKTSVFLALKQLLIDYQIIDKKVDDQELKNVLEKKMLAFYTDLDDQITDKIQLNNINREIFNVRYNPSTLEFPINDLILSNIAIGYDDFVAKN
ncbi:hypothetical protein [Ureaplasma zalophigenitalium]|uniref:Iron ABC transporter substrate-binding protein n=1 Tax=Ureaplasma zalophigenitalium TaxID=907723 RepID=A0ABT3BNN0_9BACT|nr:hypothetical protein [Ureaplasma zalophigenitalium]MCV3753778.1 hypothetical protein [Ureaplasma zalophigenitalium]